MSESLMSLSSDFRELLELAQDPEIDEQALCDTMEAIAGEIKIKAGGYVAVIRHLEGRADMYEEEAERLTKNAKVFRKNVERIKERLKYAMIQMDMKEIQTDYNVIKVVKNGGIQPLKITGKVPENYMKEKKTMVEDNEKIRKDLNAGVELSFAHLEERGTRLKID